MIMSNWGPGSKHALLAIEGITPVKEALRLQNADELREADLQYLPQGRMPKPVQWKRRVSRHDTCLTAEIAAVAQPGAIDRAPVRRCFRHGLNEFLSVDPGW